MVCIQEKSKEKNLYYPGMFDFIKGLALLSIVMRHAQDSIGLEMIASKDASSIMGIFRLIEHLISFGDATMPMFLLASGYGFRKTKDNVKCVKKQSKLLLKPFTIVACLTTSIHFVSRCFSDKNLKKV